MTEHLQILMKTLETRRMRTALEIDQETQEENPVLVRVVIAGKHKLIHPQNFIELLGENEQFIDPGSLEILNLDDIPSDEDWLKWGIPQEMLDAKRAEEATPPEQPPEPKAPEEKPAKVAPPTGITPPTGEEPGTPPDPLPPAKEAHPVKDAPKEDTPIWSEKELIAIGKQDDGYNKLRSISKLYDDIPGNISKVELIEKISGKVKI